jgi:hypothetical protein
VEEESDEEMQEPATLWDSRLDIGDFIHETFCYEKDVTTADDMDDDILLKATERHSLQLTFLAHQCRRRMVARNRDVEKLLLEKEETAKGYEQLMSDYHGLQKKSDRRKAALERIRK